MTLYEENLELERRLREVTAERDQLREALEQLRSDCQSTIDLCGSELYSASFVIESNEEKITLINAALAPTHDQE